MEKEQSLLGLESLYRPGEKPLLPKPDEMTLIRSLKGKIDQILALFPDDPDLASELIERLKSKYFEGEE